MTRGPDTTPDLGATPPPSWPRLAARMATARIRSARGRWRSVEPGGSSGGEFAYLAPDEWAGGEPVRELLRGRRFERDDYFRALGPVEAATHDGRPCWRVRLEPPARKRGVLTLLVDEATALVLHMGNPAGLLLEVTELEVDVALPDELFAEARQAREADERIRRLYELCDERPPPTPRWNPWRYVTPETGSSVTLRTGFYEGSVSRAVLGAEPEVPALQTPHVQRLEAGGWAWVVAAEQAITAQEAAAVVRAVLEDPAPWPGPPAAGS